MNNRLFSTANSMRVMSICMKIEFRLYYNVVLMFTHTQILANPDSLNGIM